MSAGVLCNNDVVHLLSSATWLKVLHVEAGAYRSLQLYILQMSNGLMHYVLMDIPDLKYVLQVLPQ